MGTAKAVQQRLESVATTRYKNVAVAILWEQNGSFGPAAAADADSFQQVTTKSGHEGPTRAYYLRIHGTNVRHQGTPAIPEMLTAIDS